MLARPQETEPMGTAGPLKLAEEILSDGSGDPFFVLNRCAAARAPRPPDTVRLLMEPLSVS
jgi:hypothetical protein